LTTTLFYIIAGVTVASALLAVTLRNLFHCALYLALAMFGVSGVFLYLDNDFLAAVQVLIYVGAVTVLIIFGIMLTRNVMEEGTKALNRQAFLALVVAATVTGVVLQAVSRAPFFAQGPNATLSAVGGYGAGVNALGPALLLPQNGFVFAFEFVSVLLLAALVGAIVIARKDPS
jgi:NADH-quinone oxidoreductase subunit J